MNRRDIYACIGGAILFIAMSAATLAAPRFNHVQGLFDGTVVSARSGVTYRPFQSVEVLLADGRVFWVDGTPSSVYPVGSVIQVRVACLTPAYERCAAMEWRQPH